MNNFELKMKLKEAYPDLKKDIITEIMATTQFINTDVQTFIDRSVSSVKDLFTVQTIDAYAEKLTTYTQDFLNRLDKLGVHWLVCHLPAGVNFYSDEMAYVLSAPFIVKSAWAFKHAKQIKREGKDKTFMMYSIRQEKPYNPFLVGSNEENTFNEEKDSKVELAYIIRGILVRKSIFAELQE